MQASARDSAEPEQDGPQQHFPPSPGAAAGDDFPAPIAAHIDRLGLRGVAYFLLDVSRPFGWLGAQLVLAAQPTLALFGAGQAGVKLAAWLEQIQAEEGHH